MLPEPINPNNRLIAKHVNYIGTTGSCKTTAIKKLGLIGRAQQVLIFDPYGEYEGESISGIKVRTFNDWDTLLAATYKARKGSKAFRYALISKERSTENLERFARIAWALGDGFHKKELHVVIEELARFTKSTAKLEGIAGELWTGGRKFGLVMHTSFQRGQEVPKTVMSESSTFYIGAVGSMSDAKYLSDRFDIPAAEIAALKPAHLNHGKAEYIIKKHGIGNYQHGTLKAF